MGHVPVVPFSLQSVLSYKESLVDLLERQLAQLLSTRSVVEAVLVSLQQERQRIHHRLIAERQGVLRLDRLRYYQSYLDWLGERIEAQERQLAQLDEEIEKKRGELVSRMQEKRVLEKLKEKAKERFMLELERREADLQDEMASARFVALTRARR